MKRQLTFILFLLSIIISSCTNLDEVYNRLDEHEKRISKIENLVKEANTQITALQSLLEAQNKKIWIVSHNELADKSGYELILSNGSKIVLKNGKDGETPVIGIRKHTDDNYYWTINGEFMRDADGNMIKAEGKDGAAGVTPKLHVNTDGYWEVSIDNGKTWELILGADGNPVKAVGKDANLDLSITEDKENIIIVYDGKTFIIPKKPTGDDPSPKRPTLAIEYVAEYNIAPDAKNFVTNHANDVSGYFTWKEATTHFTGIAIDGKNYHLPSVEEWRGIINDSKISFSEDSEHKGVEEEIQIGKDGEKKIYLSDYKSTDRKVSYGLRFLGKDGDKSMLSAWRYMCIDNPNSSDGKVVVITARLLGPEYSGTIDDIATPNFWNNNNDKDIVRYFPMSGWTTEGNVIEGRGTSSRFLTNSGSGLYCWYTFLTVYSVGIMNAYDDWYFLTSDGYSVRLFEDAE